MWYNNLAFFYRRALLVSALVTGLLATACTDPYQPDVLKQPASYLVVDGFINTQGITTIKLSRTFAIGGSTAPPVESRATAYVEEEGGPRYLLREILLGTYTSAALTLNPAKKYRLHLTTQAGKEYASDYVPAKTTPPIDAINWQAASTSFNLTVSTHDDANATRYYRWDFDETWEIRPSYSTTLEYVNHAMRYRTVPFPAVCWGTETSRTVLTDKTTALTQDVVSGFQLKALPVNSERLFTRYSIRVSQYALTKEEYEYWELLRKNTESIGSLFDPQPSQLTGNVHGLSSASDIALGFVGAHSVAERRLFITHNELPSSMNVLSGYESCVPLIYVDLYPPGVPDTPQEIMDRNFSTFFYLPVNEIRSPTGTPIAYDAAVPDCLDCRLRGTSIKPAYWP